MAKGGFDFKQYEQFVKNLGDADKDFELFLTDFLVEMAQRVLAKVRPRTPVDTGSLRASWSIVEVTNDAITIGSPMEYASFVEYGHTLRNSVWKDGRFMLTLSIEEVQKEIPKRFEKAFQQFMKGKGIG